MLLQVSVLTDQVEAQGEKIRDLEFTKEELQIKLEDAEQLLENVSACWNDLHTVRFLLLSVMHVCCGYFDLYVTSIEWRKCNIMEYN